MSSVAGGRECPGRPRRGWNAGIRTALLLGCALLPALPAGLLAQSAPSVTGTQLLNFAPVFPGIPARVDRADAVNAGVFDIRGRAKAEVQVTLTLPASLTLPGGQALPLQFTANDAGFSATNAAATATPFDPRVSLVTRLGNPGKLYIWLGGTALPSTTQAPGLYQGTITITAAYTGN